MSEAVVSVLENPVDLPEFTSDNNNSPSWVKIYADLSRLIAIVEQKTGMSVVVACEKSFGKHTDDGKIGMFFTQSMTANEDGPVGLLVHNRKVFDTMMDLYRTQKPDRMSVVIRAMEGEGSTMYSHESFVVGCMQIANMRTM